MCRDEDGLAAVLGHEIAHVRAHHVAERLSSSIISTVGLVMLGVLFNVGLNWGSAMMDLVFNLPHSRTQEVCSLFDEHDTMLICIG